jgi:hypothetical protein
VQKIISLFKRDYEGTRQIYDEVVPGAEWVQAGEGVATLKIDGTCCMVKDGQLYKRYDAKKGKTPPNGFIAAQDPDPKTGHWPGWLAVDPLNPADRWHCEAVAPDSPVNCGLLDGTYELLGPKVQGNPYKLEWHELRQHGTVKIDAPRTFEGLRAWFAITTIEGIVWHHPDGRMVKIKRKDFGLPWPVKEAE